MAILVVGRGSRVEIDGFRREMKFVLVDFRARQIVAVAVVGRGFGVGIGDIGLGNGTRIAGARDALEAMACGR